VRRVQIVSMQNRKPVSASINAASSGLVHSAALRRRISVHCSFHFAPLLIALLSQPLKVFAARNALAPIVDTG
jgi:hypothetical protein